MVKYYKVGLPSNVFYYEVEDDVSIEDMDIINNLPKDASGNDVAHINKYYVLGVTQKGAYARIEEIDKLPFPQPPTE